VKVEFVEAVAKPEAFKACPWAIRAFKVGNGYICFESASEYRVWRDQLRRP
jgi:hypothetical protein